MAALNQIGYQGKSGPVFTFDDGTLPAGKLLLVKMARDQYYNKVLIVLDPVYAQVFRNTSAGDFTSPDSDFVLGSYVAYQTLDLHITSYKYPVVLNNSWEGYKALQNNWSTNSNPYANDSDSVSYGVETPAVVTTTPSVINKAATPNNMPFFIGLGAIAILALLAQSKD